MKTHTRKTISSLILGATALMSPLTATAEEEPPIYKLDEFVFVSTRTPLSLDRVSPSVSYISDEEMERWQDQNLVDALSRAPGLTTWSNGATGGLTSLSTRGTESNHTGFFLDGRRLNPGFGNQYDIEFLSVDNLRGLEVQRGAASVNFGTSGIGGVVNARLKSAIGLKRSEAALSGEGGSNDYRQTGFSGAVGSDRLGMTVSASGLATNNERANDRYEKTNFVSRLDFALTDQIYFELLGTSFDTEKELPGPANNPTPFDEQETTSWLVSPGVRYLTDELSVHLFYARSERNADIFEVNPAYMSVFPFSFLGNFPISNEIDVISDEVDLQLDYSLSDAALFTAGLTYRNDDVSNSNLNTFSPLAPPNPYAETFQEWGFFGLLSWQLSDVLEARGGLRYDDYSEYDNELTGNFSLIHTFPGIDASIFAKIANSYAPPSAVDFAYDSDVSTPLNAEESTSYEIGFRQNLLQGRLSYSLVLFRNEIDQLLSFEPSTFDTFNIEQATTQGAEFSVEYVASDKLTLGLGYTYLEAESDRLNDPRTGGFVPDPADEVPLARRPNHLLQLSAFYAVTDSLNAGIQALGQFGREDIDPATFVQVSAEDFFVVRLVVDWKIDDNWSAYGRVENLLDEDYASAAGFPALGRAGYLGIKYTF